MSTFTLKRVAEKNLVNDEIANFPLIQSSQYAMARYSDRGIWKPQWFLASDNGDVYGTMQAIVAKIPVIGKVAIINRGPVLSGKYRNVYGESNRSVYNVLDCIRNCAIDQGWRYLRIIPEIYQSGDFNFNELPQGFLMRKRSPVSSARVDIGVEPEILRRSLHQKWRNTLNKSEKMGLTIETSPCKEGIGALMPLYKGLQKRNQFHGLSPKLLEGLLMQKGDHWLPEMFFAKKDGRHIGALMAIGYSDTCTYLIGCTNDEGRSSLANYLLLWHAMNHFHERGFKYFDVGGLGSSTTEGVGHFKRGLRGEEYSLIGEFSWASWRNK